MIAERQMVENIVLQVKQLSPEYRLRLIQQITETLIPSFSYHSKPIQFGKYQSSKMSIVEDFALAKWHPMDKDLNGE